MPGRWGGEACGRQRAGPHIKTYCRFLPSGDVAWLYVGSHNLSKAGECGCLARCGAGVCSLGDALTRGAPPPLLRAETAAPPPSPAAWGALQKKGAQLMCRSYELGVLLTPGMEAAYRASRWAGFSCTAPAPTPAAAGGGGGGGGAPPPAVRFVAWQRGASQEAQAGADGTLRVPLPIPYSLPPRRYAAGDRPWMNDVGFPGLDTKGLTLDQGMESARMYGLLEQPWP